MAGMKTVLRRVGKTLYWCVFLTMILIAAVLLYLLIAARHQRLPFAGQYKLYTIMSGSMEDTLHVGGVVLVEKTDPATLQAGDIVTFISNDPLNEGKVVTHRITQVMKENGSRFFITKGDANEDRDSAAALEANVIGRVALHVPYLGYLLNFSKTRAGFFAVLLLPCMLILICEVIGLIRNYWAYRDECLQKTMAKEERGAHER